MSRVATTLLLAVCLLGCGQAGRSDVAFTADIIGNRCGAEAFLEGVLVEGTHAGLAIGSMPLIWPMSWSARRSAGGEVEVLDGDGTVVATTGRSYKIGGHYSAAFHGFWACARVVIPF